MTKLPLRARWYLAATLMVALFLLLWSAPTLAGASADTLHLMMLALPILIVARAYSLPLSATTNVNLFATVAFGLVLASSSPGAAWVGVAGTLLAAIIPGCVSCRWYQTAFTAANYSIAMVGSSVTYRLIAGTQPLFTTTESTVAVLMAGVAFFALNVGLVGVMVGLAQQRQDAVRQWFVSFQDIAPEYTGLLAMGVALAVCSVDAPLALPVLLAPAVLLYTMLRSALTIQRETRLALEELADEVDRRTPATAGQSQRVASYVERAARQMGIVSSARLQTLVFSARIHNIGMKYVTASISEHGGSLEAWEQRNVRQHADDGAALLKNALGLKAVQRIIRHHHEHVDGTGYPAGLTGTDIPLGSRLIHVAEAFDAMTTVRPFRPALSREDATRELRARAGTQFDPVVVEALLASLNDGDMTCQGSAAAEAARPAEASISLLPGGLASASS